MAPGVGKTYEMLRAARRRKAEGQDVLIGVVETHGRRETESLLRGMEVLPRKPIDHRGRVLMEFDLDAALARRPPAAGRRIRPFQRSGLAPSQALAGRRGAAGRRDRRLDHPERPAPGEPGRRRPAHHRRAPARDGARQRPVARRRHRTVDITPDELRERLGEGKVYVPETARLASENFFKVENLTALRELALRRAAQTVDDQLVATMREKGVEGPWAAGERILVLVGGDAMASGLVRAGRRLSDMMMDAPWTVAHVERPTSPAGAGGAARLREA
jgi:two-component system sensor histidine kinase KdpD